MYSNPNRIQQSLCQQARALQLAARWNALSCFFSLCLRVLLYVLSQPSLHQTPIRTSFNLYFPWVARFVHDAVSGGRIGASALPRRA